ncbi:hypothetical protein [Kingella potus]|nr:hypothetical protein [Kingella potus]
MQTERIITLSPHTEFARRQIFAHGAGRAYNARPANSKGRLK